MATGPRVAGAPRAFRRTRQRAASAASPMGLRSLTQRTVGPPMIGASHAASSAPEDTRPAEPAESATSAVGDWPVRRSTCAFINLLQHARYYSKRSTVSYPSHSYQSQGAEGRFLANRHANVSPVWFLSLSPPAGTVTAKAGRSAIRGFAVGTGKWAGTLAAGPLGRSRLAGRGVAEDSVAGCVGW
jgi:hypothetical protein